ncbi:MAG: lipid kinase, partial [Cyanobacteria bacterium J083]
NIPLAINLATAEILAESLRQSQIAHLIFNPVAGQGNPAEDLKLITDLLSPAMELVVHQTTPELNGKKLARQLVAKSDSFSQTIPEVDLIIASGGDGTISAVAGELINTNIPLGIIPRGTANAFAFALDISNRLNPIRTACEVILAGKVRLVDAAICNKNLPMILLAGIGLEAETIAKVDREAKNRWGALAYIMAGIQQFNVQELFETKIEIEGVVKKFQAAAVTIANAAPATSVMAQGSGLVIANDGLLDITIAAPKNDIDAIASMVNLLGAALLRTPTTREDIINLQTRQIKITVNPPQKVVIDGELIEKTDCLEVECLPSSLKIFAPDKEN